MPPPVLRLISLLGKIETSYSKACKGYLEIMDRSFDNMFANLPPIRTRRQRPVVVADDEPVTPRANVRPNMFAEPVVPRANVRRNLLAAFNAAVVVAAPAASMMPATPVKLAPRRPSRD